jgi:hypothetical protein
LLAQILVFYTPPSFSMAAAPAATVDAVDEAI